MRRQNTESTLKVLFVRHGESIEHEGKLRQNPQSKLGKNGKRQARALAKRLSKGEKVDIIFTSKWNRAKETAEIISKNLEMECQIFEGIHEKEQNPDLYGAGIESEIQLKYLDEVKKFGSDLDWRIEEKGESLRDLIKRAETFMEYLTKNHIDQNIVVVSHGLFIRAFVVMALLRYKFSDDVFHKIFRSISFNNTGVTLLEYFPKRDHWELIYMNDISHVKNKIPE